MMFKEILIKKLDLSNLYILLFQYLYHFIIMIVLIGRNFLQKILKICVNSFILFLKYFIIVQYYYIIMKLNYFINNYLKLYFKVIKTFYFRLFFNL